MLSGCSRSRGYVLDLEARQVSRFRRDGRMAGRGPSFSRNLLLDALLDEERERLLEGATTHPIELGHVYLDPGDRIRKVSCSRSQGPFRSSPSPTNGTASKRRRSA